MGNRKRTLTAVWKDSIQSISSEQWDRLAEPLRTPLLEWEWLRQLEVSGSISPEEGWVPQHLTLWDGPELVAAAPLYIKEHSMGEFVFDFVWADVAERLGASYYPKAVGMSPATPSAAYRFLIDPRYDQRTLSRLLLERIERFSRENGIGTVQFNFVEHDWLDEIEPWGFTTWEHQGYQWLNEGYTSFEDYLSSFRKNQRRNIRRERRSVEDQGIEIRVLTEEEITRALCSRMYDYYERTNAQFGPWAAKFLNRRFFEGLSEGFRHRLALVCAYAPGTPSGGSPEDPLGMAFLLTKGDLILGRYWGAQGEIPELHFNVCYYAPIQWAIEHGYRCFDAGMGSAHKVRRGFRAVPHYSVHRFSDPRLQELMRSNIDRINRMEELYMAELNTARPVKGHPTGRTQQRQSEGDSTGW